ncbi:MAG: DNA/RNA non-specific endonuclease [Bacteroidales bacterium]|nr:DNA/RNA non-specific endonuclease [Bacteroidales bacterium]
MRRLLLIVSVLTFATGAMAQLQGVMYPAQMPREQIIHHKTFSLSYNSSYVMPSWVIYNVTNSMVDKTITVKAKYKPDPLVEARPATKKDYKDAGYLMAQFVNYLDVMQIEGAADETFYLTNITPMKLAFYKNVWLKTEDLIRLWATGKKGFEVICGPVLTDAPFPTIGVNKVSVAARFYKIVYDPENQQAIAFLFKNGSVSGTLKSRAVTVDEIEKLTGIDFFPELDDETESALESVIDYNFWDFKAEEKL